MPRRAYCLKVPKKYGQMIINLSNELRIVDGKLGFQRDEGFLYVPLLGRPSEDVLRILKEKVSACKITTCAFPEIEKKHASLADLLGAVLPKNLLANLPRSADMVGDIAIIELSPELAKHGKIIGEAILKANKNVRTVLAKAGAVGGTYRLRDYAVIAGEHRTDTIHKEYGCLYYVDVAKAYFSPRLSNEHNRVAQLVREGETVIDLFAGVGPFAVRISKARENVRVYAIDSNPDAVDYLKRNVRLNRVEGKVNPILGDAKQVVNERFVNVADRVIMNLPEKAIEFADVACQAIRSAGGTAHFYGFVSPSEPLESMKFRFSEAVERNGRKVDAFLFSRLVRATAPYEWQAVLDACIK